MAIGSVFGKLLSFKDSRADLMISTSGLFQSHSHRIGLWLYQKVVCGEPRPVSLLGIFSLWKRISLERSYFILNTPSNNALRQKLVFVVKQTDIDRNCQTAAGPVTEHRHS